MSIDTLRWGYAFLSYSGRLSMEDRLDIIGEAIDMHFEGEEERYIRNETYEGRVRKASGHQFVAPGFSGIRFDGEVESDKGKSRLSFLISEKIREGLN